MDDTLKHETDITWLQPTQHLPEHVRETTMHFCRRRRGPIHYFGRTVGWSNLAPTANSRGGYFTRRVFWLKPYDPYPGPVQPSEAVRTFSITPGEPSARSIIRRNVNIGCCI